MWSFPLCLALLRQLLFGQPRLLLSFWTFLLPALPLPGHPNHISSLCSLPLQVGRLPAVVRPSQFLVGSIPSLPSQVNSHLKSFKFPSGCVFSIL